MTFEQIMVQEDFHPNAEQKEVIDTTLNTVVSAGAGAGKTAVLSWRFLRLVMEEGVSPDQILTLTFTKKAASEMRERIYKRLLKAKDSLPEGTLEKYGQATISTLDSFCLQIVRGDCISYGLPRDIVNLSDSDREVLVKRLSLEFLSDPANKDIKNEIANLLMPSELMKRFFMIIAENVALSGDYDADRVFRKFHAHVKSAYEKKHAELVRLFDSLGEYRMTPKFKVQYDNLRPKLESQTFEAGDYFTSPGKEFKHIVQEGINPILKDKGFVAMQNFALSDGFETPLLQKAVERFANLFNQEKRRLGSLTFSDISSLAVKILRDNLFMRRIYKDRYRFIMIDEFQDNNSLQRDLLFLLSEKNSLLGQVGVIPQVQDLEKAKLFFVGDEKQSIYKFRGADVSVFRALQDEIGQEGKNLTLKMNYRSQSHLIDHFNRVFEDVMKDASQKFEAKFDPIGSGRKADTTKSRIIFGVCDKASASADGCEDSGELEAEAIGEYCLRVLNTDEFLVDGERPRPEDIAILFGSTGNQMNIEKALKKRNLGYQIAETRSLMLDAVANDFYNYINYLLYPEDRRSYVALLKSPFCGLCEQSIRNVLVEETEVLEIDKGRYQVFSTKLDEVRKKAFRLTIAQLVETLYVDCGYKAYLESSHSNRGFVEHYEYLYSYAVQFDSEGRSLSDFSSFIRENLGSSKKLPEATVLHRELSGIQIMTVHKSKGLEFKVVIYCGVGMGKPSDGADLVFEFGEDLVSTEFKQVQSFLEADSNLKEEAEKKRVMYVAMTRAKDHLITIGTYESLKSGGISGRTGVVLRWYADAIGLDLQNKVATKCPEVEVEDISEFDFTHVRKGYEIVEPEYDDAEFESRVERISVTDLKSLHNEGREKSHDSEGLSCPVDHILNARKIHDKFGTLCHYVLECLMRDGTYENVECNITDSERDNAALLEQAKAFADSFAASPFYKAHIQGRKTEEELRFYTSAPDSDIAVEGVIDLLVFGDDYNLVVDYKTDSAKDPEEHKIQVQTYVKVAQEVYGKKCYGTLFYLRDGSVSEIWDEKGNCVELI